MKKNLLIKLNDIIIDTSSNYDKAVKKSIEFFMGNIMDMNDILNFKKKKCPVTSTECIMLFLNEKNIFLRERAIMKKFSEYYLGREFIDGLINDTSLLIDKKKLEKLSSKHNLSLLSLIPKEELKFIKNKLGLNKLDIISADSAEEGIKKAKKKLKDLTYIGNNTIDYKAAKEQEISFIGFNMEEIESIKKIEELI